MQHKSPLRSGSPLTLCFIYVLIMVFLAPLCHSHNHDYDHHREVSADHVLFDAEPAQDNLSSGQQHNDLHLHISRDIGRTDTTLRLKNLSSRQVLSALTQSPVTPEDPASAIMLRCQACVCRSNTSRHPSGLSPPAV